MLNLPSPGELLIYDYRDEVKVAPIKDIKVLQWNVERNYSKHMAIPPSLRIQISCNLGSTESDDIIETIKRLDPDIAIIQEIDINCKRSGNVNHMERMCKEINFRGGFVAEFFELESPIRQPRDQVR
jgi:hypothetical protein